MIELKEKEKKFYMQILDDFFSKVPNKNGVLLEDMDFSLFYDVNYRIFYGITKVVLVPKNKGARYVIKMPIVEEDNFDWCDAEGVVYREALNYGVEKFFSEISRFREYPWGKAYLQKRIRTNSFYEDDELYEPEEDWSRLSNNSIERVEILNLCGRIMDELMRAYPSEEIDKLLDFCSEYWINDIHSGNYGYDNGGAPIIFDYSGIGEEAKLMRGIQNRG